MFGYSWCAASVLGSQVFGKALMGSCGYQQGYPVQFLQLSQKLKTFLTGKFQLPPCFPDSLTHSGQYKRRATQVLQVSRMEGVPIRTQVGQLFHTEVYTPHTTRYKLHTIRGIYLLTTIA